jgi:3-oxoacyl-(acyl-carrier-protein) synthase
MSNEISNKKSKIVITGYSSAFPTQNNFFDIQNFNKVYEGKSFVTSLSDKSKENLHYNKNDIPKIGANIGYIDLNKIYNIPLNIVSCLDQTNSFAVAAGIEALFNAGYNVKNDDKSIKPVDDIGKSIGIIYTSTFPNSQSYISHLNHQLSKSDEGKLPIFDRKFLLKTVCMAHTQLAEILHCNGPTIYSNNACAGTTSAIALASSLLESNHCDVVVVIASDLATSEDQIAHIAGTFISYKAISIQDDVSKAALPYDERHNGLILGSGAIGIVMERQDEQNNKRKVLCNLLKARMGNAASHITNMDSLYINKFCKDFIDDILSQTNCSTIDEFAKNCVYWTHDTFTSARGGCSQVEYNMLKYIFEKSLDKLIVMSTKGYTGHALATSFEHVICFQSFERKDYPPIFNMNKIQKDEEFTDLVLCNKHTLRKYSLIFSAGFGSQLALSLYEN